MMNNGDSLRRRLFEMAWAYRESCVLGTAAELDLFSALRDRPLTAEETASALRTDPRATSYLLDALASLDLVVKQDATYRLPDGWEALLTADSAESALPMLQHLAVLLRSWSQLPWVVKSGVPAPKLSSIRGPQADQESFIAAMHAVSVATANTLVGRVCEKIEFRHVLDVGGASGSYTLEFLRQVPEARATLFDLPHVVKQAEQRIKETDEADRIQLVAGNLLSDPLPPGADLAWISAVVHCFDRETNRMIFSKAAEALEPGGTIAIRDVVMRDDRTRPTPGALFAINMLVNNEGGGTYTFEEIQEDLALAGFVDAELALEMEDPIVAMNSVVVARKPR